MKKLKETELPEILPVYKGRDTKLRVMLLNLQVGEGIELPLQEWKRKNPPYKIARRIKKTHGFVYEYGLKRDGTGWLFRRVA